MQKIRVSLPALALTVAALLFISGCNKSAPPAPQQNAATQPAPATNPDGSAAAAPAPGSGPAGGAGPSYPSAPPAPVSYRVPANARVTVRIGQPLSSKTSTVGETFTGTLVSPVASDSGRTVFKAGTPVTGTVTSAKGQGRFAGAGGLGIELSSIGRSSVTSSEFVQAIKGKGKRTATLIGGGAGLGAIIGGLAGGGKGALIGGLAGGGAGTAGTAFTGNKEVTIPAESVVTFRLRNGLTVSR